MSRRLQLKREVLTTLSSDELGRVAGGTVTTIILLTGNVCIGNSDICLTDTCLTDVNCGEITHYCYTRLLTGCS